MSLTNGTYNSETSISSDRFLGIYEQNKIKAQGIIGSALLSTTKPMSIDEICKSRQIEGDLFKEHLKLEAEHLVNNNEIVEQENKSYIFKRTILGKYYLKEK
jgi:hypothetical protein